MRISHMEIVWWKRIHWFLCNDHQVLVSGHLPTLYVRETSSRACCSHTYLVYSRAINKRSGLFLFNLSIFDLLYLILNLICEAPPAGAGSHCRTRPNLDIRYAHMFVYLFYYSNIIILQLFNNLWLPYIFYIRRLLRLLDVRIISSDIRYYLKSLTLEILSLYI